MSDWNSGTAKLMALKKKKFKPKADKVNTTLEKEKENTK